MNHELQAAHANGQLSAAQSLAHYESGELALPDAEPKPVAWNALLGAVARGWCDAPNTHKEMDSALAISIVKEVQKLLAGPQPAIVRDAIDRAPPPKQVERLTEAQQTELLDWVSACQSQYHIDSTPGHRFGGLGSNLMENREAVVDFVNSILGGGQA